MYQAAGCALLLCQYWASVVSTPVGGEGAQVKELLYLVSELWQEVNTLRSIRKYERERLLESHPTFPGTGLTGRQAA